MTLVTIVPPSGYAEEQKAAAAAAAGAAAGVAAPVAGAPAAAAPAAVAAARSGRGGSGGWREGACGRRRQEEVSLYPARDAASCCSLSVSAIPARNTRATGTISASWRR